MSTMTCDRQMVKIGRTEYGVRVLDCDPSVAARAVRFANFDNQHVYDCHQQHDGSLACDCGDFVYRQADAGGLCKHLKSAVSLGMLDAPTAPAPAADPAPEPATCPACEGEGTRPNRGRCLVCDGHGVATAADLDAAGWGQPHPYADTIPAAPEVMQNFAEPSAPAAEPCPDCGAYHHHAGPAEAWGDWADQDAMSLLDPATDDDVLVEVELVEDCPPADGPRLTLSEALDAIRRRFLAVDSELGDIIAEAIGELAVEVSITGARTPEQLRDRRAVLSL